MQNSSYETDSYTASAKDAVNTVAGGARALIQGGSSITGQGDSLAANGVIATNRILDGARADIDESLVTTTGKLKVDATVKSIAVSAAVGENASAVAIGFSIARNLIGWEEFGGSVPVEVEAYTQDATLTADHGIKINATSNAVINATVAASAEGGGAGVGVAGLWTDNEIATALLADIQGGDGVTANDGDVALTAEDSSTITADAESAAVAADLSGEGAAPAIAGGLALALNTVANTAAAFISEAKSTTARKGSIRLKAKDDAKISVDSTAASIAVGASTTTGLALSGGGAVATNSITSDTLAYVNKTNLTSFGDTSLDATNTATIDAHVLAVSGSLAFGGETGVAASLGAGVARNFIGYNQDESPNSADTQAYVLDSSVDAGGDYDVTATSQQTIDASVLAGSVAVAASGGTGAGVSGSGVYAENKIVGTVLAYHDGDGTGIGAGIHATAVSLNATDDSTITANAAAASVAASFAGGAAVSVSIGISIAMNQVDNDVEASIAHAATGVFSTAGDISVKSAEDAVIHATSIAASLAAAISGELSIGVSGAGADAGGTTDAPPSPARSSPAPSTSPPPPRTTPRRTRRTSTWPA